LALVWAPPPPPPPFSILLCQFRSHLSLWADLQPSNIFLCIPGVESLSTAEVNKLFGWPVRLTLQDLCDHGVYGGRRTAPPPSTQHPRYLVACPEMVELAAYCLEAPAVKIT